MIQRSKRNSLNSAPRRMFGVFVLCWLNLAITPCAMAFEVADDCSHCPPAAEQEMAHHGHDAAFKADCTSMQSDCYDLETAALDTRGGKFESPDDTLAIATSITWPSPRAVITTRHEIQPPDPGKHSPRLHKLFCVYLD